MEPAELEFTANNEDTIRKDAVYQELSSTDSSLKDLLIDDISGSLFDSISWLLMNSGSLDFTEGDCSQFFAMKNPGDYGDQQSDHLDPMDLYPPSSSSSSITTVFSYDQHQPSLPAVPVHESVFPSASVEGEEEDDEDDVVEGCSSSSSYKLVGSNTNGGTKGKKGLKRKKETMVSSANPFLAMSNATSEFPASASVSDMRPKASSSSSSSPSPSPLFQQQQQQPQLQQQQQQQQQQVKKKRSRERVEDLEEKVKALQDENAELRTHLTDVSTRIQEMEVRRAEMEKVMADRVADLSRGGGGGGEDSPAEREDLEAMLRRYGDLFIEYGSSRQKEVKS